MTTHHRGYQQPGNVVHVARRTRRSHAAGLAGRHGNRSHPHKEDETSESGYALALRMIGTGRADTVSMVTHRFPLGSVVEAIKTVTNREAIEVAVLPGG